jgi:general secretion pathway protein L
MAQAAGIDISDDLLSAVLVSGTGRDAQVIACAEHFFSPAADADLTEALALLMEKLGSSKADACAVGISLSCLSLRNLTLPFTDEKKVRQVLSFELEEQLLQPAEELSIATSLAAADAAGTSLIAAAAEKGLLLYQLEACRSSGLEPDSINPAVHVLADRLCRTTHTGDTFLLLHGDLGGMQLVLVWQGEIIFMRRLAWPDDVFTQNLFACQEDGGFRMTEPEAAAAAVSSICAQIRRSLEYFAFHNRKETVKPEYFVLTGPALLFPDFLATMAAALDLPGRTCDLVRDGAANLSKAAGARWQAALHDKALALALQQGGSRSKESGLNFRQGELAPPSYLFRSKKQLAVAATAAGLILLLGCGWLIGSKQQLEQQYAVLEDEMEQVFEESFPGIKPGAAGPYIRMKTEIRSTASSAAAMPIFAEDKRILSVLADISARIPASVPLKVKQLVIDQNSVLIKGSTNGYNSVDTMQLLLSKSDRYAEAKIDSSVKGKNNEGILFNMKLLLKTESGS